MGRGDMKVRDLIIELGKLPKDAEVVTYNPEDRIWDVVTNVHISPVTKYMTFSASPEPKIGTMKVEIF